MAPRTVRTRLAGAGLALALAGGLAGCSWPDVTMSPGVAARTTATTSSSARSAGADEAAATATRTPGELDTGSTTHKQAAGDSSVVIDYWTTDDATAWTAADAKTIQVSAHIEGGTGAATKVTRFVATVDDGTSRTRSPRTAASS